MAKKQNGCGNTRDPKTAKNRTVKRSQRVPRYVSACAQCKKTRSAEIAHFKMTVLGFYQKKHEVLDLPENVGISRLFPLPRAARHDRASVMCVRERKMIFFVLIHTMKTHNTTTHAAQIHEYPGRYCVHGCETERECCAPLCSRNSSLFYRRVCSAAASASASLKLMQ